MAVPSQTLLVDAAIETDGVTAGLTTMVILFDPTVEEEAQLAVEIIVQVTTSPFCNIELV